MPYRTTDWFERRSPFFGRSPWWEVSLYKREMTYTVSTASQMLSLEQILRCYPFLMIILAAHRISSHVCCRRFTRDLLTHKTTHLIAKVPEGDKFNEAVKCGSIEIVSPGWLYACHKEQIRVATHSYCLIKSVGFDQANGHYQKKKKNSSLKEHKSCSGSSDLDLESTCSTLLHRSPIPLFSNSYLFFAGFGDRSLSVDFWCSNSTSTRENENCDKQIKGANDSSPQSLLRALLRLTRISMGTILWDLNENASHIILHQSCDKDLR